MIIDVVEDGINIRSNNMSLELDPRTEELLLILRESSGITIRELFEAQNELSIEEVLLVIRELLKSVIIYTEDGADNFG